MTLVGTIILGVCVVVVDDIGWYRNTRCMRSLW